MIATFVFTFTNINLIQDEPIRFVGLENYANLLNDPRTWDALLVTFKFAAIALPDRAAPAVRARAAAEQQVAARVALLPGALLHAVRHPVRRRALRVAAGCSIREAGWINGALSAFGRHRARTG